MAVVHDPQVICLFVDSVHVNDQAKLLDSRPQLMVKILLALGAIEFYADEVSLAVDEIHVHRVLRFLSCERPWVDSELS